MLIPKTTYIRDEKHRRFIASLPCLITGAKDVQAAHIRKQNGGGTGLKPSDEFCVPLSVEQHRLQGEIGEVDFWRPYLGYKRASKLARALYVVTGDKNMAMKLIMEWRCEIYNL